MKKKLGSRVQVVSIDYGDEPSVLKTFARKMKAPFPIAQGSDKLFADYGVDAPPANLVLSPAGVVLYSSDEYNDAKVLAAVKRGIRSAPPKTHASTGVSAQERGSRSAALNGSGSPGAAVHPAAAGPFRDVPPDHWAAQAVESLRRLGIVIGYP